MIFPDFRKGAYITGSRISNLIAIAIAAKFAMIKSNVIKFIKLCKQRSCCNKSGEGLDKKAVS